MQPRKLGKPLFFFLKGSLLGLENSFFGQQSVQVGDGPVQLHAGFGQLLPLICALIIQLLPRRGQLRRRPFQLSLRLVKRSLQIGDYFFVQAVDLLLVERDLELFFQETRRGYRGYSVNPFKSR